MSLALHIIAKDQVEECIRIINDYGQYFDEICIAPDKRVEEFQKLADDKVKIFPYEWRNDFAHKRNFLVENTKSEYYFRMDTDDCIKGVENIQTVYEKASAHGIDVVHMEYNYAQDEDGNSTASHWRETLIRKSSKCRWNKTVHENILDVSGGELNSVKDDSVSIIHKKKTDEEIEATVSRNFKILVEEFNRDKEETDPRTIAYIGRMLQGNGKWAEAIKFLEILIKKSGWDDDKYFAWINSSQCYSQLQDYEKAIACCNEAMCINTEYPDAYLQLCEVYVCKGDSKKAVHWGEIGIQKKKPETLFVIDPSTYTYRAAMNLAMAYIGNGDMEKAYKCWQTAYKLAPNHEFVRRQKDFFEHAYENYNYFKNFHGLMSVLVKHDEKKVINLVESIPDVMMKDERFITLRNRVLPPKKWEDNSIAIVCFETAEEWAAPSVLSGIGGSEEAVIYLSKELTKLGYKVTVFCTCGELAGEYAGVTYKELFHFNKRDEFNIVVSWRHNMFRSDINANKKIVWLHDTLEVKQAHEWFDNSDFDKVVVLSQFHKTYLDGIIPEEKIFVSSNGINLDDFKQNGVIRNPHRMIYCSSYDRGLQHLLMIWPDVKKEVPEAELKIFYGWDTYDKFMKMGLRPLRFREAMTELMKQEGVQECGRVGHRKLAKELQASNFWVYPSHFEEISCISAMKAQAAGCVPVCTDYAALAETVKDGIKIHGRMDNPEVVTAYKEALIKALKEQPVIEVDKEQFGWDKVAEKWHYFLFIGSLSNFGCSVL